MRASQAIHGSNGLEHGRQSARDVLRMRAFGAFVVGCWLFYVETHCRAVLKSPDDCGDWFEMEANFAPRCFACCSVNLNCSDDTSVRFGSTLNSILKKTSPLASAVTASAFQSMTADVRILPRPSVLQSFLCKLTPL